MTDHVIIEPTGELTEGDGYPADLVGCHGVRGQTLRKTRRSGRGGMPTTLRMIVCDVCVVMPDEHKYNPIARDMLLGLGYSYPLRGRVAIVKVDYQNEPLPLTDGDLTHLRTLHQAALNAREVRREHLRRIGGGASAADEGRPVDVDGVGDE